MKILIDIINKYFNLYDTRSVYLHRARVTVIAIFLVITGNMVFGMLHILVDSSAYGAAYSYVIALINFLPLLYLYRHHYYVAKLCTCLLHLINIFLLAYIIYSPEIWNYLFFILVPPFCHVMFEVDERKSKWIISLISVVLMLVCALYPQNTYIVTTNAMGNTVVNVAILLTLVISISLPIAIILFDLESSERVLANLATKDHLTNLYNRIAFDEFMYQFLSMKLERKKACSFMFIDINHFKFVNDTYGHKMGDEVLKSVAQVLKENCRKEDFITRFGGDEFLVFLPFLPASKSISIGERIGKLASHQIKKNCGLSVSISVGIADGKLNNITKRDIESIISRADKAMYQAKINGSGVRQA